jgi:hypothetical protein
MTQKLAPHQIAEIARLVPAPAVEAPAVAHPPRSFELPARLYGLTIAAYAAFLVVTAVGFASPGLIVPIAICAIYVAMAFGTPALWTRVRPEGATPPLDWARFRRAGIETATGRLGASEATVQVLILPALILAWGVATAVLYAALT